jgi:hypothetical protein
MMLHLRIAKEVEHRSGNRLLEVAEALARHYSQAARPDKAFVCITMARAKSLRIYSFEEAGRWFDAAFSLLRVGRRQEAEMGRSDKTKFCNSVKRGTNGENVGTCIEIIARPRAF